MPHSTSQILNNRYRIVKLLKQGGFGAVYRAWDLVSNSAVALKENLETNLNAQRQFEREAALLQGLSHPNLVKVTDYFSIPSQGQYLVMDYIEGDDLDQKLEQKGDVFSESELLPWMLQMCEVLDYLHSQTPPIIHRDIKPANIKITPRGRAVLVDFGIAKAYSAKLKTTVGARAVTPGYSPLEQYGHGITDNRTDIYALGATLYHLLTGREPEESVVRANDDRIIDARTLNPAISERLNEAIKISMSLSPTHRFQSARDMANSLTGKISLPAASLQQIPHRVANTTTKANIFSRKFIVLAIFAFIGLAVASGAGVSLLLNSINAPIQPLSATVTVLHLPSMTKTSAPTGARTPTKMPTPIATHPPAFSISTDMPQDSECIICKIDNWQGLMQPGKRSWSVDFPFGKPAALSLEWCAVSQSTLEQNWNEMRYELIIDGYVVQLNQLKLSDNKEDSNRFCRGYEGTLTNWSVGKHKYTWLQYIYHNIYDGWDTYIAGTYTMEFIVNVK